MKIIHTSDWHLGKALLGRSLIDDQRCWLTEFISTVKDEKPGAVVLAGDVYDRTSPSGEAVELLDEALTRLLETDEQLHVFVIAGNHDSGQRLSFGSRILSRQRLHIVGRLSAKMTPVELTDEDGPVAFWLLPYTFPAAIQEALKETDETLPRDYSSTMKRYLSAQAIDFGARNVLVAHQSVVFNGVTAEQGGSETMIGGVGGMESSLFDAFDYVALGHIHKAQKMGREGLRYAGSPLCYHFDEAKWPKKGAVRIELGAKGDVKTRFLEIRPKHPLRVVEGTYDDIVTAERANGLRGEYVKVVLTDRRVNPFDAESLRGLFSSKDSIALEIVSTYGMGSVQTTQVGDKAPEKSLSERFVDFWRMRHGGNEPEEAIVRLIQDAAKRTELGGNADSDAEAIVKCAMKGA